MVEYVNIVSDKAKNKNRCLNLARWHSPLLPAHQYNALAAPSIRVMRGNSSCSLLPRHSFPSLSKRTRYKLCCLPTVRTQYFHGPRDLCAAATVAGCLLLTKVHGLHRQFVSVIRLYNLPDNHTGVHNN